MAEIGYGRLAGDGHDLTHTAEALRDAVDSLRRSYPDRPLLWAPYTHFGP